MVAINQNLKHGVTGKAEIYPIKEVGRGVHQSDLLERRDDLSEWFLRAMMQGR